jgi:hypothetical protein
MDNYSFMQAFIRLSQCFLILFHGGTFKIIFYIPRNPYLRKQKKGAVGSTWRLLQYCQFPDKNSRDTSMVVWNFSYILKFVFVYSTIYRRILVIYYNDCIEMRDLPYRNINCRYIKLYIVFTVHLIIIGRVYFYTNLCTQSYSIISLFSPIRTSAYLKRHLQGVTKFTSIDYTILVYVVTSIYIKYKI